MNNKSLKLTIMLLGLTAAPFAQATTDWSAQDYDLYPGDFNGDGKTDILYIAKDASKVSGISLSDGSAPNVALQSWSSNYLGIPWSGNQYTVIVADFNGDGRSDIFLQRKTPGDHYLLIVDSQGKVASIAQTLANSTAGVLWSADQHRIVMGDFNFDGKADLFLQSTTPSGLNAVMLADATGKFTATAPAQSWNDSFLGFKWASTEAYIYSGNFDGVNGADLLIQARPKFVMIDYDVPFPVPTYPPHANGVLLSQASSPIFQVGGLQSWDRTAFGADWSPLASNVVIGDFNGDHLADVILQGRAPGKASTVLMGNASGSIFTTGVQLASNVTWTADSYRLLVQDFSGAAGSGIYFQALTPSGTNGYANTITGSSVAVTTHNPVVENVVVNFAYDELGRLVTVAKSGVVNSTVGYTYDSADNRTSVSVTVTP